MSKERIARIVKFNSNKIYLQIGAFKEKNNALKMQQRISSEGIKNVYVKKRASKCLRPVADPQFILNRRIYLSLVQGRLLQKVTTVVVRARLDAATLTKIDVIFKAQPMAYGTRHFGSRLLFAPDGSLLITLGDRGKREWAQDPGLDPGAIIRILSSGELPSDNPFIQSGPKRAAVFAYGNALSTFSF